MAIDRLPSGSFRARLMIDGRRYTATLPTEADARLWEVETRAAVAARRRASSVTFADYATYWRAEFIDDDPDRVRFDEALTYRLCPLLGEEPLLEVLEAGRDELECRLADAGAEEDGDTRECLRLVLEDATADLRAGARGARALVADSSSRR